MIYINNFGWRLGNQLFQIACAIGLAEKHRTNYVIPEWKYNEYLQFPIVSTQTPQRPSYYFKENGFHFQKIDFRENMAIDGYFQSEKYFEHCKDTVRNAFRPKKEIIENLKEKHDFLGNDNICSIHIRRGDYLNHPDHHPVVSLNYCYKAIKSFPKDYKFIIFSDDIEWCKQGFFGEKFIFIENQTDVEDFYLMSMCKNNIIANSSFSWWAAWLNDNPDKRVIAPSKWFGPAYDHFDTGDLIPEDWEIV